MMEKRQWVVWPAYSSAFVEGHVVVQLSGKAIEGLNPYTLQTGHLFSQVINI